MEDVAARAGVSRALVSIVLRDAPGAGADTRARVLRAAEELDYRPDTRARLLGSSRSRTLGVAFHLHHEFHAELVDQLYLAAEPAGYDLALGAVTPTRDEQRAIEGLLDFRCEALLLIGSTLRTQDIERLAQKQPVVVLARSLRTHSVDVVRTDDVAGARLAVEHLVERGHRRITHVHGRRAPGAAERRRGYTRAMQAAGLGDEVRLVPGGYAEEDGVRAAAEILAGPVPTAVTAFNDHCAAGLVAELRASGRRVPEDVAVVGFDNSHVARLSTVALTTVSQDAAALARHAVELAVSASAGDRSGTDSRERREVVVPPHLVPRSTT
jgi:DNA-binding LacI/PurR family transcriptional regulator